MFLKPTTLLLKISYDEIVQSQSYFFSLQISIMKNVLFFDDEYCTSILRTPFILRL